MTTPSSSSNLFYSGSSSAQRNGATPMDSSMSRMALDNLIRRELKVSDPNDPKQIAQALLARYKGSPRAAAITREAEGLPFLLTEPMAPPMTQAATSSQVEWQQATDDIERDLKELTTNTILKDVIPELEGWGMAIRSAIQEGVNSARFALDSRQRDKTFGIRRTLGDYARMARLVGALSGPVVEVNYRKLAQSIDEAASVLLVMMGEALANVGFSGGRYLLQVPYTELQTRRDAVIYALRNLVGSTQEAYAPNEWPRGLNAYRLLFEELEEQGQGDLRALLVENELSRLMDSLLQRAGQGGVEGLRHLGATAQLDIERLRRLTIIGERLRIKRQVIESTAGAASTVPDLLHAPPLTAFLEALQLFIQSFNSAGGFRLLRLARPPILLYGLYGFSKPGAENDKTDAAEERLLLLTTYRGMLANWLDYFAWTRRPKCQFILDKFLYDIDRAIDLYALGSKDWGKPEIRASAYGHLIEEFTTYWIFGNEFKDLLVAVKYANDEFFKSDSSNYITVLAGGTLEATEATWMAWWNEIKDVFMTNDTSKSDIWAYIDVNCWQKLRDWEKLQDTDLVSFSAVEIQSFWNCVQKALAEKLCGLDEKLRVILEQISSQLGNFTNRLERPDEVKEIIKQELCIQRTMEDRWQNLVETMAPVSADATFKATKKLIDDTITRLSGQGSCEFDITALPRHYEVSLDEIAADLPTAVKDIADGL